MKLQKGCAYRIYWQDIVSDNTEWFSKEDFEQMLAEEVKPFTSIGFYLGSNKQFDFFTTGMSNDEYLFDIVKYPKGIIIKVQKL